MASSACWCSCSGYKVKWSNVSRCMRSSALMLTFTAEHTGGADGGDVDQTPTLWKTEKDGATIDCRHRKTADYDQMYWFRQLPGEAMRLLVRTSLGINNHDFGNLGKKRNSRPPKQTLRVGRSQWRTWCWQIRACTSVLWVNTVSWAETPRALFTPLFPHKWTRHVLEGELEDHRYTLWILRGAEQSGATR